MPLVLGVEKGIRHCASYEKYVAKKKTRSKDGEHGVNVEVAFEAIGDADWWCYLHGLDRLAVFLRSCHEWAEGCRCHTRPDEDPEGQVVKHDCPLRSMRTDGLASGEFFTRMSQLAEITHAELLQHMPQDVSDQTRTRIAREIMDGIHYLLFYFAIKLAHWTEPPWLLYATPSPVPFVRKRALRTLLDSTCDHFRVRQLQGEPLRQQAERHIAGEDMFTEEMIPVQSMLELICFIAQFLFAPSAERKGEGTHAKIKKRGRGAPCHGLAFVSLGLRLPDIEKRISDDAHFIHELAALLPSTPKKAVTSIGYERHPCARKRGLQCRDPM